MKIFLSYGHDLNASLIEKIKESLSKDAEGNLKHEVWIDTSGNQGWIHGCRTCSILSGYMRGNCHFEEV